MEVMEMDNIKEVSEIGENIVESVVESSSKGMSIVKKAGIAGAVVVLATGIYVLAKRIKAKKAVHDEMNEVESVPVDEPETVSEEN